MIPRDSCPPLQVPRRGEGLAGDGAGWRVGGLEGWRVGGLEGWRVGGLEGWTVSL